MCELCLSAQRMEEWSVEKVAENEEEE